ncbi:hypothetical protein DSUL_20381 [Desulfovibrionales bacterium]
MVLHLRTSLLLAFSNLIPTITVPYRSP